MDSHYSFVQRSGVVLASALLGALMGATGGYLTANVRNADTTSVVSSAPAPSLAASLASTGFADVPGIIVEARQSVVAIDVLAESTSRWGTPVAVQRSGTGIVLRADGLIATNAHVVAGATTIEVTLPDATAVSGTVVGSDAANDLAVVHVDRTDLKPARLGDSTTLQVGDVVIALGNALALEGDPTATIGIVSALERTVTIGPNAELPHLIQTDAAINIGDSGGPLINSRGEVVGINTATTGQSIGFAISIARALPILARLLGASPTT